MLLARLTVLFCALAMPAWAGQAHVAVATNFKVPMAELSDAYQAATGHELTVSAGATGLLYSQIVNGAPFDVFLAADQDRPTQAVADGHAVPGSQITYATGRLFLMLPGRETVQDDEVPDLTDLNLISIANPRTAPYGVAAMQVLDSLDIAGVEIAYAQNAAGVVAAVKSGAVPAGLTARSLVAQTGASGWEVPFDLYDPIQQDAVLLTRAEDNAAAVAFLEWMTGPEAKAIIAKHGYDVD